MSRPKPKRAEPNAGAFLSEGFTPIGIPMRTLSDDYRDSPADPPDDHVPEPEPPGPVRRVVDRLTGRPDPDQ